MADSFLAYQNPTVTDKKLDSESLVVGANTVERERIQLAGAIAAEIARILNVAPAAADYGLYVKLLAESQATSLFTRMVNNLGTNVANVTAAGEQNVLATAQPGVDIGDVTINNAAGAAAVNVQDGGNSLTVDATNLDIRDLIFAADKVDVSGSTVDTELPAASILGDGEATPTVPRVGSMNMIFTGAVWDRMFQPLTATELSGTTVTVDGTVSVNQASPAALGNAWPIKITDGTDIALVTAAGELSVLPNGNIAHDSVDSGNPLKIGGKAKDTQGAAVTAGDRTDAAFDRHGAAFSRSGHQAPAGVVLTNVNFPAVNTRASSTRGASIAGTRHVCTGITAVLAAGAVAPTAVQLDVRLRDGVLDTGTILWQSVISLPATAGAMNGITRSGIWIPGTAATAMTLEFSAAGGANTFESVSMEITDIVEA